MGRIHGKKGVLYLGETVATKVSDLTDWGIELGKALAEDTAFEEDWETKLAGAKKWSGSLKGSYNDATGGATKQLWDAAISDNPQRFYLYPSSASSAKYFYGTAYPNFTIETPRDNVVKTSGNFEGTGALGINLA